MLKRYILWALLLFLPISLFAKKEALIVAVSSYKDRHIRKLVGVNRDVEKMKSLLEKRGFNVEVLLNSDATLANVREALTDYQSLKPNDVFLYYQSSHGVQVPDIDGDEPDGLDEAYALYKTTVDKNGVANLDEILVDDELERYLSLIPAKKFMIADACHSGTMYKSLSGRITTKGLNLSKSFIASRKILGAVEPIKNLVSISSSQSYELSIDTEDGGMFTEAIYNSISSNPNITFRELQVQSANHIQDMCNKLNQYGKKVNSFHPALYATENYLKNQRIDNYLSFQESPNTHLVEEYLDRLSGSIGELSVKSYSQYNVGDLISFNINTKGNSGYLYIFAVKNGSQEINVVYPNRFYRNVNYVSGKFNFPSENSKFQFIATKDSKRDERTVAYIILSKRKIPELEFTNHIRYGDIKSIFKDFNGQSSLINSFKNIIIQRKSGSDIYIAKKEFTVS